MKNTFLCIIICFLWASPAYAYIDLGIGSMIIQGIIASFVVCLMYFRQCIGFVKRFVFKKNQRDNINE